MKQGGNRARYRPRVDANAFLGETIMFPDGTCVEVGMSMSAGSSFEIMDGKAYPSNWREILEQREADMEAADMEMAGVAGMLDSR